MGDTNKRGLLDAEEAAAYLGVSIRTVRTWVHKGKIPCIKLNGALRFKVEELDKWVQASSRAAS